MTLRGTSSAALRQTWISKIRSIQKWSGLQFCSRAWRAIRYLKESWPGP